MYLNTIIKQHNFASRSLPHQGVARYILLRVFRYVDGEFYCDFYMHKLLPIKQNRFSKIPSHVEMVNVVPAVAQLLTQNLHGFLEAILFAVGLSHPTIIINLDGRHTELQRSARVVDEPGLFDDKKPLLVEIDRHPFTDAHPTTETLRVAKFINVRSSVAEFLAVSP
jgi:hypothetical protein